jgi:hypothetical protein
MDETASTIPPMTIPAPPRWRVPRVSGMTWDGNWDEIPALPPFILADGSGPALQQTRLRLAWDDEALHVRFDCEDRDAWGTYRQRDEPLYEEEAVEVFLAPGAEDPARYAEFEVSPLGTLFDARIHNPTGLRADLVADRSWDCPGLVWKAGRGTERQDWWATLAIPWAGIGTRDRLWRANFYRIERARDGGDGEPEFSCWSPTWTRPADFHKPARFGVLELAESSL